MRHFITNLLVNEWITDWTTEWISKSMNRWENDEHSFYITISYKCYISVRIKSLEKKNNLLDSMLLHWFY